MNDGSPALSLGLVAAAAALSAAFALVFVGLRRTGRLRRSGNGVRFHTLDAITIVVLLMAIDWSGRLLLVPGPLRQIAIGCVGAVMALSGLQSRAVRLPTSLRIAPVLIVAAALSGATVAFISGLNATWATGLVVGLVPAVLPIREGEGDPSARSAKRAALALAIFSGAHVTYLAVTTQRHGIAKAFGQEQAPLIVVAILSCWVWKRRLVPLAVAALLGAMRFYPAYSYPLAVAGATVVWPVLQLGRLRKAQQRGLVVLGLGLAALGFVLIRSAAEAPIQGVLDDANSLTRLELLHKGTQLFWQSPLVGSAFTRPPTVTEVLSGELRTVPVHNDYLSLALMGGALLLLSAVIWIVRVNTTARTQIPRLPAHRQRHAIVGLVLFDTMWLCAAVNPLLDKPTFVFLMASGWRMMMTACFSPPRRSPTRPGVVTRAVGV